MIDLHLHTTASDGLCTPQELVRRAWNVGIRVMAVTDHDTVGGLMEASEAACSLGMEFIAGIEVTAVHHGNDVHVLGYGLRTDSPDLHAILAEQRRKRALRAREIGAKLAKLGAAIDIEALVATEEGDVKALARPQIAAKLVAAGHVRSIAEAFERFLGEQCPAYVPHEGASPEEVVSVIVRNGGVASLAHPLKWGRDGRIPSLIEAGMTCLEVHCSWHDGAAQHHYLELARKHGLFPTGGSDYHGPGTRYADCLGSVTLPREEFRRFEAHLRDRTDSRELIKATPAE